MSEFTDLQLVAPTLAYATQIAEYKQEFLTGGGTMDGTGSLLEADTIDSWLQDVADLTRIETCPAGFVPATQFICVRKTDNKMVGAIQIRHALNEYLAQFGGHIGYSVRHSERGKGYASYMLKEILPICKKLGLHRVLISALATNAASIKVIERNGGIYENTVMEQSYLNAPLNRYWIEL